MLRTTGEMQRPDHAGKDEADESPFLSGQGKRIALLLGGAFLLGMGMTALVLWGTSQYFGDKPISEATLIAALLGGGGAMAIGAGLMAALFHSNQSGWDEKVK